MTRITGLLMSNPPDDNTPTPRPDVEGLAKELRETCNCKLDTSPCGAEDACRVAYRAADHIEALEAENKKRHLLTDNLSTLANVKPHLDGRWGG